MNTGQRIKRRRLELGLTQAALARMVGIKPPSLADIESGKTKRAAGETLIAIARHLKTTPEHLLTGAPVVRQNGGHTDIAEAIIAEARLDPKKLLGAALDAMVIVGRRRAEIMAIVEQAAEESRQYRDAALAEFTRLAKLKDRP